MNAEPMEIDPYRPQEPISLSADNSAAIVSSIDNSVNKALPYIWFNGVIAALALGLAIGAVFIAYIKADTVDNKVDIFSVAIKDKVDVIKDRATVSENHWRDIETKQGIMQSDLKKLEDRKHGAN